MGHLCVRYDCVGFISSWSGDEISHIPRSTVDGNERDVNVMCVVSSSPALANREPTANTIRLCFIQDCFFLYFSHTFSDIVQATFSRFCCTVSLRRP